MILHYVSLNTSTTSNSTTYKYHFQSQFCLFISRTTHLLLLLMLGPLCHTPISPTNFFHTSHNPPFPLLSFLSLLFLFCFFLVVIFFFFFLLFASSSAPFCICFFLLSLLHLSFHIAHLANLSAQNTDLNTSPATALLKTDKNLLIPTDQPHL
jgi:hypothetical protein